MAVDNIDLSGEIKAWKDAAYGKDVRAANVAAFEKIQGTVNDTVQNVNQASEDASSASQNAQKAVDDIQSAIETATSKASEAAGSATAADTSKKAAASSAAAADNSKTQAAASAAEAKKIAQGLGDFDGTAAKVKTTDTYGLVVSALGESTAQALIDAIANKVMNELINKNKIVNNLLATDASTVLAGTQGTALDKRLVAAEKAVTQLNSDLKVLYYGAIVGTEDSVVPSNTQTVAYSFNVDAGVYIAFANIRWSSNAKGSRHIGFAEKTTEAFADMNAHYSIVAPSTDGMTFQNLAVILKYENPAHVDIRVQQFSGGDLKIRTRLSLLKVKS
ncbi:MAG: hypothetical protein ACLRRF_04180 [Clostridium fessum]